MDRQVRREGALLMRPVVIRGLLPLLLLAGCTTAAPGYKVGVPTPDAIYGRVILPAPTVPAVMETVVADNPNVDADDPVLWADRADPSRALLIGTDKTRGLYVHDLSGKMLQFFPVGAMNNVDLREGFVVNGKPLVLVAAADRDRFGVMHWLLDPATLRLTEYGFQPLTKLMGEPYGFCMGQWRGETLVIANNKKGLVEAHAVKAGPNGPVLEQRASWKLGSQTEGCVFDDATGNLYVGEEDVAVWRMTMADPAAPPEKMATADKVRLVDDIEGMSIIRQGERSWLIVSSQGDSAYAVFRIEGPGLVYVGRFRIGGGGIDPVTQTDGLDAWSGPIGNFPEGAIAVHDHCDGDGPNDPPQAVCDGKNKQQNYKLIDWRDVKKALGIAP